MRTFSTGVSAASSGIADCAVSSPGGNQAAYEAHRCSRDAGEPHRLPAVLSVLTHHSHQGLERSGASSSPETKVGYVGVGLMFNKA